MITKQQARGIAKKLQSICFWFSLEINSGSGPRSFAIPSFNIPCIINTLTHSPLFDCRKKESVNRKYKLVFLVLIFDGAGILGFFRHSHPISWILLKIGEMKILLWKIRIVCMQYDAIEFFRFIEIRNSSYANACVCMCLGFFFKSVLSYAINKLCCFIAWFKLVHSTDVNVLRCLFSSSSSFG